MQFSLTEKELQKLEEWKKEVYAKGIALQKEQYPEPEDHMVWCWEEGFPYTGAIGGQFTYCFTPTSIGVTATVKDYITGEKIDLTDYSEW